MEKRELIIVNKLGLHARAAAKFVTLASQYASDIHVTRDSQQVNGKSIMGVMMLAAGKGSRIVITADGQDEAEALDRLGKLVEERFGEDE